MQNVESIVVGLVILGAAIYLYRRFRPKKNGGGGCGCGTVDCKIAKAKKITRK